MSISIYDPNPLIHELEYTNSYRSQCSSSDQRDVSYMLRSFGYLGFNHPHRHQPSFKTGIEEKPPLPPMPVNLFVPAQYENQPNLDLKYTGFSTMVEQTVSQGILSIHFDYSSQRNGLRIWFRPQYGGLSVDLQAEPEAQIDRISKRSEILYRLDQLVSWMGQVLEITVNHYSTYQDQAWAPVERAAFTAYYRSQRQLLPPIKVGPDLACTAPSYPEHDCSFQDASGYWSHTATQSHVAAEFGLSLQDVRTAHQGIRMLNQMAGTR